MNRDDENWFDALAGKPTPGTASATLQEASALRAAVLSANANTTQAHNKVINMSSAQRLRERLRSEGLIPAAQSKSNTRRTVVASLAATLLIGMGITATLQEHAMVNESDTLNTYRGGAETTSVFVTDPKISVQQLEQKLKALNIQPQIQCSSTRCIMEAYIPNAQEAKVNSMIEPINKSVGPNGQLLLHFQSQKK